jgi:hypothetical protein
MADSRMTVKCTCMHPRIENKENDARNPLHEKDEQNKIVESNGLLLIFIVCVGDQKSISTIIE